ncbi:hypothetical protein NAAC61_10625 [Petrotoga sp. 8T1HF07.NaAc.6.1]|nr:hypothetical protein [Petrotoga sp. 8T1HF07.NaAc.6.1]
MDGKNSYSIQRNKRLLALRRLKTITKLPQHFKEFFPSISSICKKIKKINPLWAMGLIKKEILKGLVGGNR